VGRSREGGGGTRIGVVGGAGKKYSPNEEIKRALNCIYTPVERGALPSTLRDWA